MDGEIKNLRKAIVNVMCKKRKGYHYGAHYYPPKYYRFSIEYVAKLLKRSQTEILVTFQQMIYDKTICFDESWAKRHAHHIKCYEKRMSNPTELFCYHLDDESRKRNNKICRKNLKIPESAVSIWCQVS